MKRRKNKLSAKSSGRGRIFGVYFFSGVALLIAAFLVLSRVNPDASNFEGRVVPFIFLASWGVIIYGILNGGNKNDERN